MIEIEKVNCQNLLEARQKENEHYNLLNATLNSIPPYKNNKYINKLDSNININNNNNLLDVKLFTCESCNFKCKYKRDYERHITTNKHKLLLLQNKSNIDNKYICVNCNKNFKDRSGLWKHNKCCNTINNTEKLTNLDLINFIKEQTLYNKNIQDELLLQIKELKNEINIIKEKINI
jgi:hypothetical protein